MVLRFPPRLAPVKAAIFPLTKKEGMPDIAKKLAADLRAHGITVEYDESGSIGKRYRRQDEIGTPWCFTIDGETVSSGTVTVRNRDSMSQERLAMSDVIRFVQDHIQQNTVL